MPPRNKKAKSVPSLNKSQPLPTLPTTPRQCIDQADSLLKQQKLLVQWREARPTGPNGTRYEEELVDKIFYTIFRQTARPIQVKVVCQIIFERRDCILTARTGLGKSRPLHKEHFSSIVSTSSTKALYDRPVVTALNPADVAILASIEHVFNWHNVLEKTYK